MSSEQYRIPVDQLEGESRVARQEQVLLVGDGAGPPPVTSVGPPVGEDADGE